MKNLKKNCGEAPSGACGQTLLRLDSMHELSLSKMLIRRPSPLRLCDCMCVSCEGRLIQLLACFYFWTMKLEGIHQSFMSSQRKWLSLPASLSHHSTLLPPVVMRRITRSNLLSLFNNSTVLVYHHGFLCAHQRSVDRESAINDYTIREEALKSNTFQFRNHKLSELVTNYKWLWSNGGPLN